MYHVDKAMNDCDLLRACLRYLSSPPFISEGPCATANEVERRRIENPFISYAALHWHEHAHDQALRDPGNLDFIENFLRDSVNDAWTQLYEAYVLDKMGGLEGPLSDSLEFSCTKKDYLLDELWKGLALYYAALFGFDLLVEKMI